MNAGDLLDGHIRARLQACRKLLDCESGLRLLPPRSSRVLCVLGGYVFS